MRRIEGDFMSTLTSRRSRGAKKALLALALCLAAAGCSRTDAQQVDRHNEPHDDATTETVEQAYTSPKPVKAKNPASSIVKTIDLSSYVSDGQMLEVIRGGENKLWFQILENDTSGLQRMYRASRVYEMDLEDESVKTLHEFDDMTYTQIKDVIEYHGSLMELQVSLQNDNATLSVLRDGEIIHTSPTDVSRSALSFMPFDDSLYYIVSDGKIIVNEDWIEHGEIYAIDPAFEIRNVFSQDGYLREIGLERGTGQSGCFAFEYSPSYTEPSRVGYMNLDGEIVFADKGERETVYALSSGLLILSPNGDQNTAANDQSVSVSFFDPKTGEREELYQTWNSRPGAYLALDNDSFLMADLSKQMYFGQFLNRHLEITPLNDLNQTGIYSMAYAGKNRQLIVFDSRLYADEGDTGSVQAVLITQDE